VSSALCEWCIGIAFACVDDSFQEVHERFESILEIEGSVAITEWSVREFE
jgi:hypothetical protein